MFITLPVAGTEHLAVKTYGKGDLFRFTVVEDFQGILAGRRQRPWQWKCVAEALHGRIMVSYNFDGSPLEFYLTSQAPLF